jgi:hypothetical protein
MNFTDGFKDARDAGMDDLLRRLNLRRMKGGVVVRYALPALALAGAAAIGWVVALFAPPASARKLQRRMRARPSAGHAASRKLAFKAAR